MSNEIRQPDIEKTTISVRSFAASMWAVIIIGGGALVTGAFAWANTQHELEDHGKQLNTSVIVAAETKAQLNAKLDVILTNQQDMKETIAAIDRKADATQKRMDDYRPFKWSTPMSEQAFRQMQQDNAGFKAPDAQKIHDDIINYTP